MSQNTEDTIDEWVTMLQIGLDPDSPFAGIVDLSPILELPIPTQELIYEALPEKTRAIVDERTAAALEREKEGEV